MHAARYDTMPRSAGGVPSIKPGEEVADKWLVEPRRHTPGILERNEMTPLIACPPPNTTALTESVPALEITVSGNRTRQETETGDSGYLLEGIDYDSITVPDAAPRGTFADPLDGPEPFDD